LAIDLVRRGLSVRIVDKAARAFDGSRAKGLQPRSLEVLEDLGALDDVLDAGTPYPKLGIHVGPFVVPWKMYPRRSASADVPYPNTWLISQFRTDRALHDRLGQLGVTPEFGKELTELTENADSVLATVAGERIVARYVVGADGGSSVVRKQLGIGFVGSTDESERLLLFDVTVSGLSRDRWHVWAGRAGRAMGGCPLPGGEQFQWMIQLAPGEDPSLDKDVLVERIRSRIKDRRVQVHDVHWTSVYRPNIRLAESYGRGRVFLVGDAAHVHTPAGAQGLNTGIQDSYNLGWKLAQVLAGADAALLETYEAERAPIAVQVLGLSTEKWNTKLDRSSIKRGKDEQQLALTYFGGPLAPTGADRTTTLQVGDRAPDAELNGGKLRLFDALRGPHFTAIAHGTTAAQELERLSWPAVGADLKRVAVGPNATDSMRRAYGLTGDALLLIRPDGYVGCIATHDFRATTEKAVRSLTP
jgi:2-polyprenyl-6-methoxyphenol hydroxylase-like FAD-dependent oxidoreductase